MVMKNYDPETLAPTPPDVHMYFYEAAGCWVVEVDTYSDEATTRVYVNDSLVSGGADDE